MHHRGIAKIYLYPTIFLVAVVGLAAFRIIAARWGAERDQPIPPPPPPAATLPATIPVVETTQPKPLADLIDLLLDADPGFPTTQPLDLPADLHDAAKLVIDQPVYLDAFGRLWITHPKGQSIDAILRKPIKSRTLIVTEHVIHVHYPLNQTSPTVFTPFFSGGISRITNKGRDTLHLPLTINLNWSRATRFGQDGVLVPDNRGATLITPTAVRQIPLLPDAPSQDLNTAILSTGDSFVVWAPADDKSPGAPVAIFEDQTQQRKLDWFNHPLQFIILADGSVLGVGKTEEGVSLKLVSFAEPVKKTPQQIELIQSTARNLAHRDPRIREKAQNDLEAMGPGIYTDLEALRPTLPLEARSRIETILGQRFAPTLGDLKPLPGVVQTVARFSDGGCVLLLTGGGILRGSDETVIPAWVSIRPGQYIERLAPAMIEGFVLGKYQFFTHNNEWVVYDPVLGMRRWIGSQYETLLPKKLRHFDIFVGIDGQNRWIFRSTAQPEKTLLIDPSLPDTTPRLPVWQIEAPDGAGWTNTGWPAVLRGKQVFVLGEKNWRLIDEKTETFDRTPPQVLKTTVEIDGKVAYELVNNRVRHGGSILIDNALNATTLHLANNKLFLAAPGVVHRFDLQGKFESTFARHLPPGETNRIWCDPAGRLIFATDAALWVSFPEGRIPKSIKSLMLQQPADEDD